MRRVIRTSERRYKQADKSGKAQILDEVCANTGWRRDQCARALRGALRPQVVRRRVLRPPKSDPKRVAALNFCWAAFRMPTAKRLAPVVGELVAVLRPANAKTAPSKPSHPRTATTANPEPTATTTSKSCCAPAKMKVKIRPVSLDGRHS